jgi:hypothetical protein
LQDLRRNIYVKAKAEPSWRFWGLYVHVCKMETLREAYTLARKNNGAPGVDGVTFAAIEAQGVENFLEQIKGELIDRTYVPLRARRREIVQLINPILRGWVNYFAIGHSSECFSFIEDWVEKKIRRHMGRSRNRRGFGWKRWSRRWLYEELKLFNGYRIRRVSVPKALPA